MSRKNLKAIVPKKDSGSLPDFMSVMSRRRRDIKEFFVEQGIKTHEDLTKFIFDASDRYSFSDDFMSFANTHFPAKPEKKPVKLEKKVPEPVVDLEVKEVAADVAELFFVASSVSNKSEIDEALNTLEDSEEDDVDDAFDHDNTDGTPKKKNKKKKS